MAITINVVSFIFVGINVRGSNENDCNVNSVPMILLIQDDLRYGYSMNIGFFGST